MASPAWVQRLVTWLGTQDTGSRAIALRPADVLPPNYQPHDGTGRAPSPPPEPPSTPPPSPPEATPPHITRPITQRNP